MDSLPPDLAPACTDDTATTLPPDRFEEGLRIAEALIFASDRPVRPERLQLALPEGLSASAVLTALAARTAGRPVELVEVGGGFAFRTALDLAPAITRVVEVPRRLPKAAMEALSIVAYHQPVTRAEIEELRGAALAQSTLDALLEAGLVAPKGKKEAPGRPTLWGTTGKFLDQFGLKSLSELPRKEELVSQDLATLPLRPADEAENDAVDTATSAEAA
ncbi:MAG: SMC-Scp complex subunit ScpB [Acetobacteraceae bacterium]|nr:SMC-Scp complex subunit ScpB [Acetobacteraceae bacterium]